MTKRAVPILLLLTLTLITFLSVSQAGYITWDDYRLIVDNPLMTAPFGKAMTGIWAGFIEGDYTPLPHTIYWLEIASWGKNGAVHHVTNLLFHLINVSLLYKLLNRACVRGGLCFTVCLMFAIHPLQVESVAWISDLNGLMNGTAALLALLALQNAGKGDHPYRWHGIYALCLLVAALCKATAIFLPLAVALALWFFVKKRRVPLLLVHLAVFAAISLPLALVRRLALINKVGTGWDISTITDRLSQLSVQIPTAIGHYVASFFWPFNLSAIYPGFAQMGQSWHYLCAIGVSASLFWIVYTVIKRQFNDLFALLWFFALLAPVLNIFPRAIFVNDRYMYLPIIGLTYAVGTMIIALMERAGRYGKLHGLPGAPLFALSLLASLLIAWVSHRQSLVWSDDMLFWSDVTKKSPQSPLGWNNLAMTAKGRDQYPEAEKALLEALQIAPDPTSPRHILWRNLGDLYLDEQKWSLGFNPTKALGAYASALREMGNQNDDGRPLIMLKYAIALIHAKRPAEARELLQRLSAPDAPVQPSIKADAGRILELVK